MFTIKVTHMNFESIALESGSPFFSWLEPANSAICGRLFSCLWFLVLNILFVSHLSEVLTDPSLKRWHNSSDLPCQI